MNDANELLPEPNAQPNQNAKQNAALPPAAPVLKGKEYPGWDAIYKLTPEQAARIRESIPAPKPLRPLTAEEERAAIEREFAARHALRDGKLQAGHWDPFPVDKLPEPCRRFVTAAADAVGCDESFIVLPLLSALAAAVGNSRSIRLEEGWDEPSVIWSAIVGEGGTLKSPALDLTLEALCQEQRREMRQHEQKLREFPKRMREYRERYAEWKERRAAAKGERAGQREWETERRVSEFCEGGGILQRPESCAGSKTHDLRDGGDEEPVMPVQPICRRSIVSKVSIEALEEILADNPRGVLLFRDELAGWLASFDARRGGKGSDAADWLTTFNARALVVDRGRGQRRTLDIPRAAVSVTGGIQPAVLRAALSRGQAQEGFGARLLLSYPPRHDRRLKLQTMPQAVHDEVAELFRKLRALEPDCDADGELTPRALPLLDHAKPVWRAFYQEWAFRQANHTGDAAAVFAKMECYTARFALIIQLVRAASGEASPDGVDRESMNAAHYFTLWFAREARRILALFAGSSNPDDPGPLVQWIDKKGGRVSVSQLMRGPRAYRTPGAAEAALEALVLEDRGFWTTKQTGGPPLREFVLKYGFDDEGGESS